MSERLMMETTELISMSSLGLFFSGLLNGVALKSLALNAEQIHYGTWVCLIISALLVIFSVILLNKLLQNVLTSRPT